MREGESVENLDAPLFGGPWRPVVYLPLRSVTDPDDVVCFTGTGNGARRAVAKLCRVYAREGPDRQGKSPAITLNTWSFDNKSGGKTTWPDFKNVGWEFFTPGVPAPAEAGRGPDRAADQAGSGQAGDASAQA